MQAHGTFIVIEGGEGVGKTTQINLLKEVLPKQFPDSEFVFSKEPGGTDFARKAGEIILSDLGKNAGPKALFDLFMAARFDHVEKVIAPALAEGKVLICDRYIGSTFAYQVYEAPELAALYKEHLALLPLPDLTLIFDVDPQIAVARLASRTTQPSTHFDERELEYHARLRKGFHVYAEEFAKDRAVFIDASHSIEEMHQATLAAVTRVLG